MNIKHITVTSPYFFSSSYYPTTRKIPPKNNSPVPATPFINNNKNPTISYPPLILLDLIREERSGGDVARQVADDGVVDEGGEREGGEGGDVGLCGWADN